ncbi:alpha-ketoglutarate-dependent dioxygenase AlkB [Tahibacter amnicola]|uniref:Alpha-ketoglutarate-dependent dioxygenase AlkB n=1 Tax=Tahibacter amnicola TaxID=2976241 RepID=A0ABY6BF68_9GAMM|nr:alpha-ketoglutarate-dependent dioxygenase AlkB [Tahibacter amnicola]UXI68676.1 alpha-ketoglutarate-dependent dioxygenase AlkB [Tahibacter amnicola]
MASLITIHRCTIPPVRFRRNWTRHARSFHSDDVTLLVGASGISILSLGGARPIVFRHKTDRSREHVFVLTAGSLLHMSQAIQAEWLHAIPKVPDAAPRISLTLRAMR